MLTERETEVLHLMSEGLSNKLIADALNISDHTAKCHTVNVMAKLVTSNRTESVVEGIRRGLVIVGTPAQRRLVELEQDNIALRLRVERLELELEQRTN